MAAGERKIARRLAVLPLLTVWVAVQAYWFVSDVGGPALDTEWAQTSVQVLLWVVPCIGITMASEGLRFAEAVRRLGLTRGFWTGCAFGIVATAPLGAMVLIGAVQWPGTPTVAAGAVLGPFAESVLFSGFLFTQLFRRAQWGLVLSLALSAASFGLAHIEGVGDIAAIAAGGLLFTWVFYRWNSLWPAIALHGGINFWWMVAGEGRLASFIGPSVTPLAAAQASAIVLAVVLTLYWTRPTLSALRSS